MSFRLHGSATRSTGLGIAVALSVLMPVSGCATTSDLDSEASANDASGIPSSMPSPALPGVTSTPPSLQVHVPHDDELPSSSPAGEATETSVAADVMAAFCRPAMDQESWIDGLYPFLSQTAAVAYETVDPAKVPCTGVTGDARIRDGDGTFTVRVLVPTDAGEYSVYVHRSEVIDPWLVEQITPLAGE